jgi:hypothetical protein
MKDSANKETEAWEGEGGAVPGPLGIGAVSTREDITGAITAGRILVSEGTHLPNSLLLQSEPYMSGWAAVKNDRAAFEKEIQEAGWTFFFMAGEIKATAFGFDKQKTLCAALKRLITNVKSQKCNSLEITRVTDKSFLKVPYVSVSAHPRHLQKGAVFSGER